MKEMMKSYLDDRMFDGPNRKNIRLLFHIWQDRIAWIYIDMQNLTGAYYQFDVYEIPEEIPFEDITDYLMNQLTEDDISIIEEILEKYADVEKFSDKLKTNFPSSNYDICMNLVNEMMFR